MDVTLINELTINSEVINFGSELIDLGLAYIMLKFMKQHKTSTNS